MNKSLKRIFTLIVLFLPIVSQYKSIIPGLSIADLFLVLINIVIAIELMINQYKFSINKIISNLLVYNVYNLWFNAINNDPVLCFN